MSLKMVWANFTKPSLHLLEQPLMVTEGRQALLSAPRRAGTHLGCPWHLEPAWANPERWTHPRSSRNSTAASAVSPASASREPAGHDVGCRLPCSLPPPPPAVHPSPRHGRPQDARAGPALPGHRALGGDRGGEGRLSGAAGRSWSSPRLCRLSFLHGSGNVAINTPVRREGTATQKTLRSAACRLRWLSRSLPLCSFVPG